MNGKLGNDLYIKGLARVSPFIFNVIRQTFAAKKFAPQCERKFFCTFCAAPTERGAIKADGNVEAAKNHRKNWLNPLIGMIEN